MKTKKCNRCHKTKNIIEFNNNKTTPDKKYYQCRECDSDQNKQYYRKHKEERLTANKRYFSENKHVYRDSRYRLRYGISLEEYNSMLDRQNGVCAICGKSERRYANLVVDHDHATGSVRGLLCSNCNNAIGNAFDDVGILKNMIDYLNGNKR